MREHTRIVWVEWIDSVTASHWISPEDVKPPVVIHSLGWLVRETPNEISLSANLAMHEGVLPFGGVTTIPKISIHKLQDVDLT